MSDSTRTQPELADLKRSLADSDRAVHGPAGVVVHGMLISGDARLENWALKLILEVIIRFTVIPFLARKYHRHPSTFADEVGQESLIKVWKKRHRYDPRRGTLHGWVTAITRNVMNDFLRGVDPAQALPEDPECTESDEAGEEEREEDSARVRRPMDVLVTHFTPLELELLLFVAEYTGEEWTAAAIERFALSTTPGALRTRVSRLRQKLHRLLADT